MKADYVVVGAGAAGCALANRLSEDPRNTVILIEAGGSDRSPLIHAPGGLMPLLISGKHSWNFKSTPQQQLNGRTMFLPRGKVLGGGSSINGMIYDRGTPGDYDGWAALGNQGWAFEDVLPYFKRAETYHPDPSAAFHGASGPVHISRPGVENPLAEAFLRAGQEAGYPYNPDTNGADRLGFGPIDMFVHRGRRSSAAVAYLRPAKMRRNLTTITQAHVIKIVVQDGRAKAVSLIGRSGVQQIDATKEIIICAGGIVSPQLLMLSGIGDEAHLRARGIKPVLHLPGVGQNLQDHLSVYIKQAATQPVSMYRHVSPINAMIAFANYVAFRKGPLASSGMETVGYVRTRPDVAEPDAKLSFMLAVMNDELTGLMPRHGFAAHVCVVRPKSRGTVTLLSADPLAAPAIDHRYLTDPQDIVDLRNAIRVTRDIFGRPAFDQFRGEELQPGASVASDEQIDAFIRQNANADYHTSGTCKMGSDPMAVVDAQLRVRGIDALRVADTSIMPTLVGGNTNMPAIMIGEKAADLIQNRSARPTTI